MALQHGLVSVRYHTAHRIGEPLRRRDYHATVIVAETSVVSGFVSASAGQGAWWRHRCIAMEHAAEVQMIRRSRQHRFASARSEAP